LVKIIKNKGDTTIRYILYILRWIILAYPGYFVLQFTLQYFGPLPAMLVSQGLLGAVVFWIDRKIFTMKSDQARVKKLSGEATNEAETILKEVEEQKMNKAYVICCNDEIEAVVIGNESLAEKMKEKIAKEYYHKKQIFFKTSWGIKTYEEYRKRFYWHIHDAPSVILQSVAEVYICPNCSTLFPSNSGFNEIKVCPN